MRTVITVIGKDSVGIIAKASEICSATNVNIEDITQSVLKDVFVMVMLCDISKINCSFGEFSEAFSKFGKEKGLDVRVIHEDVFNSMHRI